jgi:hypothetical protein
MVLGRGEDTPGFAKLKAPNFKGSFGNPGSWSQGGYVFHAGIKTSGQIRVLQGR